MLRPSTETDTPPVSKTQQYKKITKPLLERKRRARMNRCYDDLKDLMTGCLHSEGENISKLEKADILGNESRSYSRTVLLNIFPQSLHCDT